MSRVRILSVGQCGFDHGLITSQLGRQLDAEIVGARTHEEARKAMRSGAFDLVLVNRIGDADGARGLDLIRSIKADPATSTLPVMLVSNYPDAQAEAVALGALPGFGKADLGGNAPPEGLASALDRQA